MSLRTLILSFTLLLSGITHADTAFRQLHLQEDKARPLDVAIWYPTTQTGTPETVGDNPVFVGTPALRNAQPATGKHPLLLLSHGYGGNWRNLNWLAQRMAAQGYIVAAPDHPGTTTRNKVQQDAWQLWQRPRDLRRVMNDLIGDPAIAGQVDTRRIAALGHSLGGWTVMELAGARFDAGRFQTDCKSHPALAGCKLIPALGINRPEASAPLRESQREPLIKAVVSLDLGLARGFTPESLAQLNVPVLILSAQADSDELPARLESGYLQHYIPATKQQAQSVTGATHFSFMQLCKPGAKALIEAQDPGEGIVCEDGGSLSRADIHQRLSDTITAFLQQALDYPPRGETQSGSPR
ncbi:alpha/beta fold hydrolase [Kosakonia sp. S58]|uniref:alpha/beta hydrolase family protein n=1 Tax=unclassified Kosakonia TaxID=2632876 RepID=UPI001907BD85|nr:MULTISPECIES: alpha/beta fold hydrolase [unclassified Kosakonia]MBK0082106.1 alpha/beta fold hydrolase [Kosakonia sp. S57]MBK0089112.1 alpha/beta fold hydrolase [Kosakonia sp. S58]